MRLHVVDAADKQPAAKSRKAVVLIHGLFGALSNLSALARALASDYRVIRLDLRNHGRSPHAETMTIPELAADVADTLDGLGVASAALVGHSLGGKVVMELALSQPQRVAAFVAADIAPVKYPPFHSAILQALEALDLSIYSHREDVVDALHRKITDRAVCQFLAQNIMTTSDGLKWRMNTPVLLREYDQIRQAIEPGRQYAGPCLFIGAELSGYIQPEYAEATKALFPHYEYRQMQGVGHWLHAEKPELFNAHVMRFLGDALASFTGELDGA